jgi:hypothetical protein
MKLKKGSKAAKDFMAGIRATRNTGGGTGRAITVPALEAKKARKNAAKKLRKQKKPSVLGNVLIFEYIVSYGGKYYVSSNMELKGTGIKKVGTGQDHKRGLKTYLMTQTALKKMQSLFGKENTKYIQTDY